MTRKKKVSKRRRVKPKAEPKTRVRKVEAKAHAKSSGPRSSKLTPKQTESLTALAKAKRPLAIRDLRKTARVVASVLHVRLEALILRGLVSVDRKMGQRGNLYKITKAGITALGGKRKKAA